MRSYKEKLETFVFHNRAIPETQQNEIARYLDFGILPGDFLTAVISNNLFEACNRADNENLHLLPVYAAFFYNHAPGNSWGSREKMWDYHLTHKEH